MVKIRMLSLAKADLSRSWKIEDSEALYRIEGWGEPTFRLTLPVISPFSPKIAVARWIYLN